MGGLRLAMGELASRDGRDCVMCHMRPTWKGLKALGDQVAPGPIMMQGLWGPGRNTMRQ